MLYFNKKYHFDNLRNINKSVLKEIQNEVYSI